METIHKVPVTPDYVCVFVCARACVFTCVHSWLERISIEVYTTSLTFNIFPLSNLILFV